MGALRERDPKGKVYLCGSYARGDWRRDSDIDLIVVSRIFARMDIGSRFALVKGLVGPGHSLDLLAFTPGGFEKASERSIIVDDMLTYAIEVQ